MNDVVSTDLTFPDPNDKSDWLDAAKQWRMPYWDWALRQSVPHDGKTPALFRSETISIRVPEAAGGQPLPPETVSNPLYRYQLRLGSDKILTKMGDESLGKYSIRDDPVHDGKKVDLLPVSSHP